MPEVPIGAIENGREFLRRLVDHYDFQCEAGNLRWCYEYQELVRCFEHMAEYIQTTAPATEKCSRCDDVSDDLTPDSLCDSCHYDMHSPGDVQTEIS